MTQPGTDFRVAALAAFFVLALLLTWPLAARAHELKVDQLSLWPNPAGGSIRGQLMFDPELARDVSSKNVELAKERVVHFVRSQLVVEVDGRPLDFDCEVRELWERGGAVPADSVMLEAQLPSAARRLRVRAPPAAKELMVTVFLPPAEARTEQISALIRGGEWTPALSFGAHEPAFGGKQQPATPSGHNVANYLWIGFRHILPSGLDHVLFILALVLGSERKKRRLMVLSLAFTFAHTLTLAMGAVGWLLPPARLIEPVIALSIAAMGLANLRPSARRYEPAVVFAFGLLHGLGFAGALADTGITKNQLFLPLLCFNVGVELGQLVVVMGALLAFLPLKSPESFRKFAVVPLSIVIAGFGLFWAVERALG